MQNHRPELDHAPPPRHREGSGRVIRVAAIAGILGLGAAGYAIYADEIDRASNTPLVQEQHFAEADQAPFAPLDEALASPQAAQTEPADADMGPEPIEAEAADGLQEW